MLSPNSSAPVTPPAIETTNLFFSYSGIPVLKNISFQIQPGEFVGMIGPNGGGKTTLLKLILGFLSPSKGEIHLFGQRMRHNSHLIHRIAYVPQSVRFDRDFPVSVEEVVLLGLLSRLPWHGQFRKEEKEAAKEALELTDLSDLKNRPFGSLSGGQAQRVLIARALVSKPELLLLDEPTASVDNRAEADIYTLLNRLKGKMTILMVTHDLAAAIDQVERILCVQKEASFLNPEEVCQHFALGLYHSPLIQPSSIK